MDLKPKALPGGADIKILKMKCMAVAHQNNAEFGLFCCAAAS
jgi:hypothetical protein